LAGRLIFRVQSPLGDAVTLSRDRWRQIVRFKHPAMAGQEKLVRECIRGPELIRQSAKEAEVHLYYAAAPRGWLCVVVAPGQNNERFVVTAYFTRNIKAGPQLWTK
jgi:hypothetical protein